MDTNKSASIVVVFEEIRNTENLHFILFQTLGCVSCFKFDRTLVAPPVLNCTQQDVILTLPIPVFHHGKFCQ